MSVPVREWTHWAAGFGVSRVSIKLLARRGDPFARLVTIDSNPVDDLYPLIEQVRGRGRMVPLAKGAWVSADAPIVREVLRNRHFRTLKPQDHSPFRLLQWVLAKTDPDLLNPLEPPSMLVTDPPEHTRLRRLVSRAFTPRALERLQDRVRSLADELLTGLEANTECDLIAAYASQIPLAVIAEMMAIPRDDTRYLQRLSQSIQKLVGTAAPCWPDYWEATKALRAFDCYIDAHIEQLRHSHNAESILSDVVHHGDLTDWEIKMLAGLLLGAGFITTTHVFGKAVVALIGHPEQVAKLRAEPEGWPNAIEEILRYDTTGQVGVRIATENTTIEGYPVRPGERVFVLVGGANRDPAVFDHPEVFDTTRTNAREHLSFGSGVHACLGAALARTELQIGLQALFEHFPQIGLAGEPIFNRTIGLHGLKYLPVSLSGAVSQEA